MNKFKTLLTAVFASALLASGLNAIEPQSSTADGNPTFSLKLEETYRRNRMEFNNANTDLSDTSFSKIKLKRIAIWDTSLKAHVAIPNNVFIKAEGSFGLPQNKKVSSNKLTGSDFNSNFSRQYHKINGTRTYDLSVAAGYHFGLGEGPAVVSPYIGWGYHNRKIHLVGDQKDRGIFTSEKTRIKDHFKTKSYGPFAGLDLSYKTNDVMTAYVGGDVHLLRVRQHSPSYFNDNLSHGTLYTRQRGYNYVARAGISYALNPNLALGFELSHEMLRIGQTKGHRVLKAEGERIKLSHKLHKTRQYSNGIAINLATTF